MSLSDAIVDLLKSMTQSDVEFGAQGPIKTHSKICFHLLFDTWSGKILCEINSPFINRAILISALMPAVDL